MHIQFTHTPASLTITLANGCTIHQLTHPHTNEPVTESNYLVVAQACVMAKEWESYLKLQGVEIDGVMCSATSDDQNGLNAVFTAYQIADTAFEPTRFDFSNGNSLVITKNNINQVVGIWLSFRQSFFTV